MDNVNFVGTQYHFRGFISRQLIKVSRMAVEEDLRQLVGEEKKYHGGHPLEQ